jgi:translin
MLSKKDLNTIQRDLSRFDRARERVLDLSRAATRMASSSILEIHRGDLKTANTTLEQAEKTLQEIEKLSADSPELRSSNSVIVAFQEYVEAITLRKIARNEGIVSMEESGADHRSYILGLLDAIGEFRRMALNSLRKGDVGKAEKLLDAMEGVYDDLQTLEHSSIVPTFRVKMDAARRIIETTRGDVVTEVRRFSLEQALDRLGKKIEDHK